MKKNTAISELENDIDKKIRLENKRIQRFKKYIKEYEQGIEKCEQNISQFSLVKQRLGDK